MNDEVFNVRAFDIKAIKPSCTWIILGRPGTGKSLFIEDLIRFNQEKFPTCHVSSNVPKTYRRFCKIFPPAFVTSKFDLQAERAVIARQKELSLTSESGRHAVYVLDDIQDRHMKENVEFFKELFKRGSRHWNMLTIVNNQGAMHFPPEIRGAATYYAIFDFPNNTDRLKLYNNYGGQRIFGTLNKFNKLMDELTGDFTCIVVDVDAGKDDKEAIFYYKADYCPPDKSQLPEGADPNDYPTWTFNPKFEALWDYSKQHVRKKLKFKYDPDDNY